MFCALKVSMRHQGLRQLAHFVTVRSPNSRSVFSCSCSMYVYSILVKDISFSCVSATVLSFQVGRDQMCVPVYLHGRLFGFALNHNWHSRLTADLGNLMLL